MLDLNLIRDNPEKVKKGIAAKGYDANLVDQILGMDKKRRQLIGKIEELRKGRNEIAQNRNDSVSVRVSEEGKKVKEQLKNLEPELKTVEEESEKYLLQIPNLPLDDVPVGKSEAENVEIKKWGTPKKFSFPVKDHLQLGKDLQILDFETGAKVTGSQFYFLYNEGVFLEMALVRYAMELLQKEGFTLVLTPDLAKAKYYLGTGYQPKGKEAQIYTIEGKDLGLIATAEVTLAGKHSDEIIDQDKLPLKYVGYSHCFRQEAGSYGKYSKGLYRIHQFTKAEMFIYCLPEESEKWHQFILEMEEKIYQDLGISYRVLEMCTGDLGAMAAKKYDIEAWMPGRSEYGEITSTSNCTDFQARNLNAKFRRKTGKVEYLHMLNGTAIAISRTLIAILENYQQKDGSVLIPEVLQKYCGFKKISSKNSR